MSTLVNSASHHFPRLSPLTPLFLLTRCLCSAAPLTTAAWIVYYYLIAAVDSNQGLKWMLPAVCLLPLFLPSSDFVFHSVCFSDLLFMHWPHGGGEAPSVVSALQQTQTVDSANKFLKFCEHVVRKFSLLQYRLKGENSVVSHFGGLYCRFYFAKTGLDVSDNIVHIHTNCSHVNWW